jgi:hypothetical protein
MIAMRLTAILALSPIANFAHATTAFSSEAVALRVSAVGISLSLADTGALPFCGNLCTSPASLNVLGLASADVLKSISSGSGTSIPPQASVANQSLMGGLVAAHVVKSNSSATCSGSLLVTIPGAGYGLNTAPQTPQLRFCRLNQGVTS